MLKEMEKALNKQLNNELYSAYVYFGMSAYFESIGLRGFAHWMRIQAKEEMMHVMKYYTYLCGRNSRVVLTTVGAPKADWKSPVEVFEEAYNHEKGVTADINKLVDMAIAKSDHATHIFLQWFVTEQVEEESSTNTILQELHLIGKDNGTLFMLDRELASRTGAEN